ncbi:MAG TPA: HesA/MoeB/ThiF family protein [Bdellovibrionales bacterium]|nr:HesA/MoeB/ThiF family protein [Bdellovibrionales bacterium]
MRRYHRQTILPQVGHDGQTKLLHSKVLVIGAGGLGHPVAQYLAAMGVGHIEIVDGDEVNITNLHRQILFSDSDVGKNKARVLAEKIGKMNPEIRVSYESVFLNRDLALRAFADFDLIIDCTDNFESKFLINDVCALYDKPMIYGAVSQFEGQIGVFWKSKGSCYRCLYPSLPKASIQNCAEAGVVGPVVGAIGSLQALEAMKILIGKDIELSPLIGRVNFYNFCDQSFRSLKIPQRSTCPCHRPGFNEDEISGIEQGECRFGSLALLVDVREKEEWNEFHIEGSYNLPLSGLEAGRAPEFGCDQEVILVCKAGVRAKRAKELLVKMNYKNVRCSSRSVYEYQA